MISKTKYYLSNVCPFLPECISILFKELSGIVENHACKENNRRFKKSNINSYNDFLILCTFMYSEQIMTNKELKKESF